MRRNRQRDDRIQWVPQHAFDPARTPEDLWKPETTSYGGRCVQYYITKASMKEPAIIYQSFFVTSITHATSERSAFSRIDYYRTKQNAAPSSFITPTSTTSNSNAPAAKSGRLAAVRAAKRTVPACPSKGCSWGLACTSVWKTHSHEISHKISHEISHEVRHKVSHKVSLTTTRRDTAILHSHQATMTRDAVTMSRQIVMKKKSGAIPQTIILYDREDYPMTCVPEQRVLVTHETGVHTYTYTCRCNLVRQ